MKRALPLALLIAAGLVALVVVLARLQALGLADHGRVVQVHHGYLGGLLALACLVPLRSERPAVLRILLAAIFLLGAWWLADDLYQHVQQFSEPFYRSPWHRWAAGWGLI